MCCNLKVVVAFAFRLPPHLAPRGGILWGLRLLCFGPMILRVTSCTDTWLASNRFGPSATYVAAMSTTAQHFNNLAHSLGNILSSHTCVPDWFRRARSCAPSRQSVPTRGQVVASPQSRRHKVRAHIEHRTSADYFGTSHASANAF